MTEGDSYNVAPELLETSTSARKKITGVYYSWMTALMLCLALFMTFTLSASVDLDDGTQAAIFINFWGWILIYFVAIFLQTFIRVSIIIIDLLKRIEYNSRQ